MVTTHVPRIAVLEIINIDESEFSAAISCIKMQHFSSDLIDCQSTVNSVSPVLAVMFNDVLDLNLNFMNFKSKQYFR